MRLLIAFAALALMSASPALSEPLPVQLVDGATWTQTSHRTRTDESSSGRKVSEATSVIRVTYRSNGDGPDTLLQEFVSIRGKEGAAEDEAVAERAARQVYPAELEVDESLRPTRVVNWEAMRQRMTAAFNELIPDPTGREAASRVLGIDDEAATNFFKEAGLLSLGQATNLKKGKPVEYEDAVPNLLGGPPIAATGKFELITYQPRQGVAHVRWTQVLDAGSMKASMAATVPMLLAKAPADQLEKLKAQFESFTIERNDTCLYAINVATGLASRTECTVDLATGAGEQKTRRIEHWLIEQSTPEVH